MLQQFSWTTFFIFYAVLSAVWYLLLGLTVYRKDAMTCLSGGLNKGVTAPDAESGQGADLDYPAAPEVMGRSRMPEGLEIISMGALNFAAGNAGSQHDGNSKSDQLGLVPDVLQELKEIFAVLAKEDGTKQDFFSLAAMISEKYGRIGSSPNIGKINEFIRDHAPFSVSLKELENLWD
ncbi:hypothetical protein ACTJKC_15275 [Pedobacter sp. 22226]|uniref:hypothetical protein n=1 Tax=Pedobacter sp. 22226 TaxID=3453894 RepID=UPI003F869C2C